MLSPVVLELKASINEFSAKMREAEGDLKRVERAHGKSAAAAQAASRIGRAALFGLATATVVVGYKAVEMADSYEKARARMEAAFTAAGKSVDKFSPQIGRAEAQMRRFGFTSAQTDDALSRMVVSTQSPTTALARLGLAADLAKARNLDLASAADIVDRALNGQLRPLKALGIDLPVAAGGALKLEQAHTKLDVANQKLAAFLAQYPAAVNKANAKHQEYLNKVDAVTSATSHLNDVQGTSKTILDALTQRLGGQAQASADTFAGKVQAMNAQLNDLGVKLGMAVVPALTKLLDIVSPIINDFANLPGPVQMGTVAVLGIGAAALSAAPKILAMRNLLAGGGGVAAAAGEAGGGFGMLSKFIGVGGPWALAAGAAIGVGALLISSLRKEATPLEDNTAMWGKNKRAIQDDIRQKEILALTSNPDLMTSLRKLNIPLNEFIAGVTGSKPALDDMNARLAAAKEKVDGAALGVTRGGHAMMAASQAALAVSGALNSMTGDVRATWQQWNSLTAATQSWIDTAGKVPKAANSALQSATNAGFKKSAGLSGHATGGNASGTFLAGEFGPELVSVGNARASVMSAGRTSAEMSRGGSQPIHITLELDRRTLASVVVDPQARAHAQRFKLRNGSTGLS